MSVFRRVIEKCDEFDKAMALSTTPQGEFGWTVKDTSSAGAPTDLCTSGDNGQLVLTLANTSEAEIVTLYQNDVLNYRWDHLQYVEWLVSQPAAADDVTTLFFGVASAQNDTIDSITERIGFKVLGSSDTTAIVVDYDDATNTSTSVATGAVMSSTLKRFGLDFTDGLAKVKCYIDGARVAAGTTIDMSDMAAGHRCQMFAQLQKASGTGVPSVAFSRAYIRYRAADGA